MRVGLWLEVDRQKFASNRKKRRALAAAHGVTVKELNYLHECANRYKTSVGILQKLTLNQGGRCGICRRLGLRLVVDHDHKTGQIRGMLCNACNSGLGMLGDGVDGLERAIGYLNGDMAGCEALPL